MIVLVFTDNYNLLPHFLLSHIILQNLSQITLLGCLPCFDGYENEISSFSVTPISNVLTIRITKHANRQKSAYSKHLITATVVARDKAQITLNTKISHH